MDSIIIRDLPGMFARTISGGTRTEIKLSRPWQPELPIAPEKCPFCTKPQGEIPIQGIPAGWRFLSNAFTPYNTPRCQHRLIIPSECWGAETLQKLGGLDAICEVLETMRLVANDVDQVEMYFFIHVGKSAGQNLGHAHWHSMEAQIQRPFEAGNFSQELLIRRFDGLEIIAMGAHAGECLIVPQNERMEFDCSLIEQLGTAIDWIITRGNERFRSTEGRPPEFMISIRISTTRFLRYVGYCPVLTFWGSPEFVLAPLEGGPITLPWPHEVTATHLR